VAVVLVLLGLGRRSSPAVRTALFGVAAGAASGLIAVLVKAVAVTFDRGFIAVLTTWQTWALIGAAIAGFLALQNALQAGRLAASQPVTLANPAVALVWGIGCSTNRYRPGGGWSGPGSAQPCWSGAQCCSPALHCSTHSSKAANETRDRRGDVSSGQPVLHAAPKRTCRRIPGAWQRAVKPSVARRQARRPASSGAT